MNKESQFIHVSKNKTVSHNLEREYFSCFGFPSVVGVVSTNPQSVLDRYPRYTGFRSTGWEWSVHVLLSVPVLLSLHLFEDNIQIFAKTINSVFHATVACPSDMPVSPRASLNRPPQTVLDPHVLQRYGPQSSHDRRLAFAAGNLPGLSVAGDTHGLDGLAQSQHVRVRLASGVVSEPF